MGIKQLIRLGDASDHGGHMVSAGGHFRTNGKVVCVDGDTHQCPIHGHGNTPVAATTTTLRTNGKSVVRSGDKAGCGATLVGGSPTTSSV
jgi:uncharacterized Zn-binding protein involved in type VI secretion